MIKITIDKNSEQPLYIQIRDAIQREIQDEHLKSGERLPTVTAFAEQLGVTQATIRRAFEDLSKEGLIVSHVGRGTFVSMPETEAPRSTFSAAPQIAPSELTSPESVLAARRLRMGVARSLNELMALAKRPGLIQFTRGVPGGNTMRSGILKELVADALQAGEEKFLGYGDPGGMPELRAEIAGRASKSGLRITPEQVLITSGSQQAIALLAQAASEDQQRVICETPCYRGVPNAFGAFGHWVETVVRDQDGPLPERLQRFRDKKPSLFYLCPQLHNPMGTDLAPDRRDALLQWTEEQEALLVSDEIYHDLRIEGDSPGSFLTTLDPQQAVVIDSLSKTFMSGLRVGWLISSAERVRSLSTLKRAMDIACPLLVQGIALSLLRSGEYDAHIRQVKEYYRKRRDLTLEALQRYMPEGVSWTRPKGGFQLWLELPAGYSSVALFLLAIERGVAFIPGPMQDINHRFMSALRLCYGFVEPDQIPEGIELLADAVSELLKSPPGESGLSGLGDFQ